MSRYGEYCDKCGSCFYLDMINSIARPDCYLTTLVCDILGLPDDYDILMVMRSFRNNILQKESRYLKILNTIQLNLEFQNV